MTTEFFAQLPQCDVIASWSDERDVEHARVVLSGARNAMYHFYDGAASRSETDESCSVCDALAAEVRA